MPTFHYVALDAEGRSCRGQLEAASEAALDVLLRRQGQWLAEVEAPRVVRLPGTRARGGSVPRRVLIEFFLQLSIQLKAGVPLLSALEFGATDTEGHAGFHRTQQDLLDQVKAGVRLSDAMREQPRVFAPLVVNLVCAGEASGRLAETCRELHRYYDWVDRLAASVRQALIYPAFVFIAAGLFLVLVFTFVVPRFASLLGELGTGLPLLTRLVMGVSGFLVHRGWVLLAAISGLVVAVKLGQRGSDWFALGLDRAKLALPVLGPLAQMICLSRFAQNLAILFRAGLPLIEALDLTRGLVGNRVLDRAVTVIQANVNEGRPVHEAMSRHRVFPRLIVQMVHVGENTGGLSDALQNVADYYNYNEMVPQRVKKVFGVLEPLMIVGLVARVGTVALAIFLPIARVLGFK
jgi:type II secretory pathway component PulF